MMGLTVEGMEVEDPLPTGSHCRVVFLERMFLDLNVSTPIDGDL